MDFITLEKAILDINNLHSSISKSYFKQDSINLRTVCVKDVVDAETGKITEHFLKYIDDYYYQLNIALVKSDFEYDYSFWDARMRIKQKESVRNKLYHYQINHNQGEVPIQKCLNDLLGFRLVIDEFDCKSDEIISFLEGVKNDLNLMKWYTRDKEGYQGTHLYFKNAKNIYFPWELQLWTTEKVLTNEKAHEKHVEKRSYIDWPKQYKKANLRKDE
ncbi:hypothetical protein [Enterococcus faecalis]|uniref:hypothetical protein n=1 Tax=Enterococcus faecalis TaxID=1351 RepID=UPI000F647CF9|nr:hypothetical protein [Enterococcus faecalis]RRQ98397.1 hypothetical protein CUR52_02105 [Enterococcus faecalis]